MFQKVVNEHNWKGLEGDADRIQMLQELKASLNSS
jgi:hypothetical protein